MTSESETTVKGNEPNQPIRTLGKYAIERQLGQGGMGTVYLARHGDLKKYVALKVLGRDKARNPTLVRRFKAEAQAAAHLEHPNIVAVYDTGEADGYLYISMEFVDGIDLFEYLRRRKTVPVKRSIDIMKQAAAALQHAFEQNIVHRDIKPSNLMLRRDGIVKLTDLGLARSIDETLETDITRAGTTVGTVDYMAPEQARNSKSADIRSDIYSLGCTWYQMLTGQPPYPEGGMMNKLTAHAIKPLPDPRELNDSVPEGVYAILQRMTAKKPADRYQTPEELLEDLEHSMLTDAAVANKILSNVMKEDDDDEEVDEGQEYDGGRDDEEDEDDPPDVVTRHNKESAAKNFVGRREIIDANDDEDDENDDDVSDDDVARGNDRAADSNPTEVIPVRQKKRPFAEDSDNLLDVRQRNTKTPDDTNYSDSTKPSNSRPKHGNRPNDRDSDGADPLAKKTTERKPSSKSKSPSQRERDPESAESRKKSPSNTAASENDRSSKPSAKPLPPKRSSLEESTPPIATLDLEALKRVGLLAGAFLFLCSLGVVIFRWGGAFDSPNNLPQSTQQIPEERPVIVKEPIIPQAKEPVANNFQERPKFEFEITKDPWPSWAAADAPLPRDLPILQVGSGLQSATQFSDINDALRAVEPKGAILKLQGNGPFLLTSVEFRTIKKLVITNANAADQPLIILKSSESLRASGLSMANGDLDLRGVHFVLDHSSTQLSSIITVTDGQLSIRNCSFSATGGDVASVAAVTLNNAQSGTSVPSLDANFLLDRVVIRGNGLTGLKIQRSSANVVLQDSLFVTGTAPAIELSGRLALGGFESVQDKPRRMIRVLRSTLCARKHLFDVSADNSTQPPFTAILMQDSICSAEGTGGDSILVSATRWPIVTSDPSGWLTNLRWTSVSSLYLGFGQLAEFASTYKCDDVASWMRVWGLKKLDPNQFQKLIWQESSIPEISSVHPSEFDSAKLPFKEVSSSTGELPGCIASRLNVPRVISQSRLHALSQRSKLPVIETRPIDVSKRKKIDLTNEDLGQVLSRNDWPSGTVFEASGYGTRRMSPAKISNKSVQIIFRQIEKGDPLKLKTLISDSKSPFDAPGFITIEDGVLELQSMVLETSVSKVAFPWLIHATNSSVILKGCLLSGPQTQDVDQHPGLICWSSTNPDPIDQADQTFLSISDSMLMTTGIGLRAECSLGSVFLRNSIFAVRGHGIKFLPRNSNTTATPSLDLDHVTFSTSKSAICIEPPSELINSPMRMYVDNSVVVTPLEFKPGEADESTVVEFSGTPVEPTHIEWWGNSNGFSSELRAFFRRPNSAPVTTTAGWQAVWDEFADYRLLSSPKGVQLLKPLPNKWSSVRPSTFLLDPSSAGAQYCTGPTAIGADIPVVDEAMTPKKVAKESQPAAKPNKSKGNKTKFDF